MFPITKIKPHAQRVNAGMKILPGAHSESERRDTKRKEGFQNRETGEAEWGVGRDSS